MQITLYYLFLFRLFQNVLWIVPVGYLRRNLFLLDSRPTPLIVTRLDQNNTLMKAPFQQRYPFRIWHLFQKDRGQNPENASKQMKHWVFILFPLMGTEKVKSYQPSIMGREVLFTSFLPRPQTLYHMKHTQSGINTGGITATQKCLDLFLCMFQLFIVTRMFNGLTETNMKISYIYLEQLSQTSNNQKAIFMGACQTQELGPPVTKGKVSLLFAVTLSNSVCCLQCVMHTATPALLILSLCL